MDIATPEVFIGGLLGAMLVFLFSAWACQAVGRSAQAVVNEVHPAGPPHSIAPESHAPSMQTLREELATCLMGFGITGCAQLWKCIIPPDWVWVEHDQCACFCPHYRTSQLFLHGAPGEAAVCRAAGDHDVC